MRNTFFKIWIHAIIHTAPNTVLIDDSIEPILYLEIEKRLIELGCEVSQIGGTSEHVHLLFAQNPLLPIHETIEFIKGITQRWYQLKDFQTSMLKFEWSSGYSAYSVSESNFDKTVQFIKKQKEFHQKYSVIEEMQQLIKWHKVDISDDNWESEIAHWNNRYTFSHLKKSDF